MALFKGRDADTLPLLTQLYQLDMEEREGNARVSFASEIVSFFKNQKVPIYDISQRSGDGGVFFRSVLLAEALHSCGKEIMEAAADCSGVKASTLSEFSEYVSQATPQIRVRVEMLPHEHEELRRRYEETEDIEMLDGLVQPGTVWEISGVRTAAVWPHMARSEDAIVPLSDLRWGAQTRFLPIVETILNDLLKVALGKLHLKRCSVCSSPFVVTRKTQVYCSWRCQNRERVRRWRSAQNRTQQDDAKNGKGGAHLL